MEKKEKPKDKPLKIPKTEKQKQVADTHGKSGPRTKGTQEVATIGGMHNEADEVAERASRGGFTG